MPEIFDSWYSEYKDAILGKTTNLSKAQQIIQKHFPKSLFRYGSFDSNAYWEDIVLNSKLHVSMPYSFNDPFDCELSFTEDAFLNEECKAATIKYLKKRFHIKEYDVNRIRLSTNLWEDINTVVGHFGARVDEEKANISGMLNGIDDLFKKHIGVICFSEYPDSILMWSHYGNYHTGFCVELDMTQPSDFRDYIYPVIYQESRNNLTSAFLQHNKHWAAMASICKSSEWSYEREWRCVMYLRQDLSTVSPFFISVPGLTKSIYLGVKVDKQIENKIVNSLNVPIFKMEMANDSYSLIPKRIN